MATDAKQKTIVIGAGPVGALAALYAARRGDDVEVYELRGDLRDPSIVPLNFTKSINLALSERGVYSMKKANCPGLLDSILDDTIPMHGRMIHGIKNDELFEESQIYDVHGRFVRAIDRAGLNKRLLDELEQMPNVKLLFNHKLTGADLRKKKAWLEDHSKDNNRTSTDTHTDKKRIPEKEISFDLMIGADGAHSAVRFHLMKYARLSFQQEYIDTLWSEFHIEAADPSDSTSIDGFKLSPNHLHIWPAGDFMFIAIPSMDKSFTCTLFMAETHFKAIDADPSSLIPFFEKNFPGIVGRLIPASDVRKQYDTNPHLPLISIKCSPYHYASSAVILGDAAHAMVPFYGQGMNAGLEDVRTLFDLLDTHNAQLGPHASSSERETARASALANYTALRTPDAHAINDLAMGNYREMRSDVRSPFYLLRKGVEERLDYYFPSLGFATQYSRVSFENQRYSEVQKSVRKQGEILGYSGVGLALASVASAGALAWRWYRR